MFTVNQPADVDIALAEDNGAPSAAHARSADEVLRTLDSSRQGLSAAEAAARLARYGRNELIAAKPRSALRIVADQFASVVIVLLLAAALIAFLTGDSLEAVAILVVLSINVILGALTELRARRAMESLLRLDVPRAQVLRAGNLSEIDAHGLVPGDVIALEAGRSVPADARLLDATELRTNESALTGESLPVSKRADTVLDNDASLADRSNMVYRSTMVVHGVARAVVIDTGMRTEVGRIGELVESITEERTPLERRLDRLGHHLIWITLLAAGAVVAAGLLRGLPWPVMLETGIALAIAAVPEGLPAVITIALAVGIHRMAKRRALVRRLPAVEALGSTTLICTDKTGTLTAGEQTVTELRVAGRDVVITGIGYQPAGTIRVDGQPFDVTQHAAVALALRIAALANDAEIRERDGAYLPVGDPTDAALLVAAAKAGMQRVALLQQWPVAGEVPFSSERQLMATFHRQGDDIVAHVKGAPARVLALCTSALDREGTRQLDDRERESILDQNRSMAARGLRVLALASGAVREANEDGLHGLTFAGFAGMIDPPADGVHETVARFRSAGIRTVMLTGDQRLTAEAIARDLGVLQGDERVVEARDVDAGEAHMQAVIRNAAAFSRVSPETKLRLVTAFQSSGEIVAMLGDGVNDAAALKKADVGVAMGVRGTDVAREAADVVLSDDRFQTVAAAIEEGRVIYDNIRKFVFYLFSCNLAEILVLLIAALAGLPVPLTPLQLLWLNIVTDTFPALSLALEPAEPDIMKRPPRDPDAAIMSRRFIRSIFVYATLITLVTLAAFSYALGSGNAERAATFAFMTLAFAQLLHLGTARSTKPLIGSVRAVSNRWALGAVVVVVVLQLVAVHVTPLARVLGVTALPVSDWLVIIAAAAVPALFGQIMRYRFRHAP